MTKDLESLNRPLTEEELEELKRRKEASCQIATESIKITQKTTAGYEGDLTKYAASRYVEDAFNYGWDKTVCDNQGTTCHTQDPSKKIYRNSIAIKTAKWALPVLAISVAFSFVVPVIPVAVALGMIGASIAVGVVSGVIDGYVENRTIKRATNLGEKHAQKEMSDIKYQTAREVKLRREIEESLSAKQEVRKDVAHAKEGIMNSAVHEVIENQHTTANTKGITVKEALPLCPVNEKTLASEVGA